MEQYKKAEGEGPVMSKIDFEGLANEIEKRMDDTKNRFNKSLYDVLREKEIKAKFWPGIIEKTSDIIKNKRPELFPKSWIKKEVKSETHPKIDWKAMSGARRNEYLNTVREDKDKEEK